MSEDIVNQLRKAKSTDANLIATLFEGANEIERLRQRLKMSETRAERWKTRALKAES